MTTHSDDETPSTPAEMLALMRDQRRSTRARMSIVFSRLLIVWAVAWTVGFLALWSADTIGGNPFFRIPPQVAWPLFGTLMIVGIVWSAVTGIRSGRDIRGRSKLAGMLYGWSWSVAMAGAGFFAAGLQHAGLPGELSALLYPGLFTMLVGVQYLGGAALERSPAMFALGVVMIATVIVATWVGSPTHYLLYGTVGPVAMLTVAALMAAGVLPAAAEDRR